MVQVYNNYYTIKYALNGEPYDMKVSRTVRRGLFYMNVITFR